MSATTRSPRSIAPSPYSAVGTFSSLATAGVSRQSGRSLTHDAAFSNVSTSARNGARNRSESIIVAGPILVPSISRTSETRTPISTMGVLPHGSEVRSAKASSPTANRKGTALSYDFLPERTAATAADINMSPREISVAINAPSPAKSTRARVGTQQTYASNESFVIESPILHPGFTKPLEKLQLTISEECDLAQESPPLPARLQAAFNAMARIGDTYNQKVSARCPCCCVLLGLFLTFALIGIGFATLSVDLDTDFSSFMKTDATVSIMRDGYLSALSKRKQESSRRLSDRLLRHYNLFVLYEVSEGRTISDVLHHINDFELHLRSSRLWHNNCMSVEPVYRDLCSPGLSLAAHAYPENEGDNDNVSASPSVPPGGLGQSEVAGAGIVPEKLSFNGEGDIPISWATIMNSIRQADLAKVVFPKNINPNSSFPTGRVFRSAFHFKMNGPYAMDSSAKRRKINDQLDKAWEEMIEDILPNLDGEQLGGVASQFGSGPEFKVYYEGSRIEGILTMKALSSDLKLAAASLCFLCCYVLFHTGSFLLSFVGLFIVSLSIPLAFVLFGWISGSGTLSIASFLSLFLVIGFGTDDLFVFTDTWRHSKEVSHVGSGTPLSKRLSWTMFHAGKSSLATSVTTALSFFANLASVLKPLREFGVFMGLCVMCVWTLTVTIYAPLCIVDEYWLSSFNVHCWLKKLSEKRRQTVLERLLGAWVRRLHSMRRCVVGFYLFVVIAMLVPAMLLAKVDGGLPRVFTDDERIVRGEELFAEFPPLKNVMDHNFMPPDLSIDVCAPSDFGKRGCRLFWCETPTENDPHFGKYNEVDEGSCQCWRKMQHSFACHSFTSTAPVRTRIIGPSDLSASTIRGPIAAAMAETVGSNGVPLGLRATGEIFDKAKLADVVLHDWYSGDVRHEHMHQISGEYQRTDEKSACAVDHLCFCGTYTCKPKVLDGWVIGPKFDVNNRRLSEGVNLSTHQLSRGNLIVDEQVNPNSQALVDVTFGLKIAQKSVVLGSLEADDMWSFLPTFDVSNAWTQRDLLRFCTDFPAEMRVVEHSMNCWIKTFRTFVLARGKRFPVPQHLFQNEITEFIASQVWTGVQISEDFLWVRDQTVKACYMMFYLDVKRSIGADEAEEYINQWNKYTEDWNTHSNQYAVGAVHSSKVWVRVEAQRELISSTIITFVVVIVFAFIGMLVFTLDLTLSIFVVTCTTCVVVELLFFIVVVMRWEIGAIEVIALIVFIGYAVTYTLHIAYKYASSEGIKLYSEHLAEAFPSAWPLTPANAAKIRYTRASYAAKSIGGAALGSAITTAGCSIFLISCKLALFMKLGSVVLVVTLLSIFTALVPLLAMLLMLGPLRPGSTCCCCLGFLAGSAPPSSPRSLKGAPERRSPQSPRLLESPRFDALDETIMITVTDDFVETCRPNYSTKELF